MKHAVSLWGFLPTLRVIATPSVPDGLVDDTNRLVAVASAVTDYDPCCRVLVFGSIAMQEAVPGQPVSPQTAPFTHCLPVKLRVSGVNGPHRTLIDGDCGIVVQGNACIEVLAPQSWVTQQPDDVEGMVNVTVWLRACPVDLCCHVKSRLSWFTSFSSGAVPAIDRTFLVPRFAERMRMSQTPGAIARVLWGIANGSAASPGTEIGREAIATSQDRTYIEVPQADTITLDPEPAAIAAVWMAWELNVP